METLLEGSQLQLSGRMQVSIMSDKNNLREQTADQVAGLSIQPDRKDISATDNFDSVVEETMNNIQKSLLGDEDDDK